MCLFKNNRIKDERMKRNQEICDLVKKGEYVPARINLDESWYPKRPPIKKDKKVVKKLFEE